MFYREFFRNPADETLLVHLSCGYFIASQGVLGSWGWGVPVFKPSKIALFSQICEP